MVILDSYVNDSLSYIVAKRIAGRFCNGSLCFSQYGCFCNTLSQKRVYSQVRNSSTVHKQENIVCTQVEIDINTGVFILRTVDLTVWCYINIERNVDMIIWHLICVISH